MVQDSDELIEALPEPELAPVEQPKPERRLLVFPVVLFLAFLILFVRLYQLQVLGPEGKERGPGDAWNGRQFLSKVARRLHLR
jgi:hypothetical protein